MNDEVGDETARRELAQRIAGDITLSDEPGATLRKWRTDFDVSQTRLADELNVSSSVISDYEGGRRSSPGIGFVRGVVEALLDIDHDRGSTRLRQYARVLSAGFEGDVVRDLREYQTAVPIERVHDAVEAESIVTSGPGTVSGHTVVNSIAAIRRLSSGEFYRLYGRSTSRAMVFSEVTRGESPLVALRVVNPKPAAVILHGIDEDSLWKHAATLARKDDYSLAVSTIPDDALLEALDDLPN